MSNEENAEGIAIIGMAGRFPGAKNIEEFWNNLCQGVESITFFSAAEDDLKVSPEAENYVRARGVLDRADHFDAAFFGMTPQEAVITDPQHRVFLECAWEALENAGCVPDKFGGSIGVFGGMSMNTYLANNLAAAPALMAQADNYQLMLSNDKDYLPTRVSYKLNLKGPSLAIQTACSTSLSAVCVACQNLLNYDCDVALAGAVSVSFPQRRGYYHHAGGVASADGHCRSFDANASGTVPGEGVGIVVLKRLDEALANGDRIYAVIKGFAMNNDGSSKMGFTAPSIDGEAEVIATALAMAGFSADSIAYVEAHGTGTPLGDPIEIEGLAKAFRVTTEKTNFCAIGSVKSNIGHLDTASGMAGLIKAALSLYHKRIPASLNFNEPNPKINFANSPFYVNDTLQEWQAGVFPRRAGVSSFGMGGTNTHVVLEEMQTVPSAKPQRAAQLLLLSAKTQSALEAASGNLAKYLVGRTSEELADAAFTLQTGRHDFSCRRICVCREGDSAAQALVQAGSPNVLSQTSRRENPAVTFLFPGQGTQQVNMAMELYQHEPVFREEVDRCARLLEPHMDGDIRQVIYPASNDMEKAAEKLKQTEYAQPALFVIEYALAKLWMSWGIRPTSLIGHSLGEYVAACLSGVFTLADALMIVAKRGQMMQLLEPGKMLAVRAATMAVRAYVNSGVSFAAANSPLLCVLSGPGNRIDEVKTKLDEAGIAATPLQVSHAFHSEMMEPMMETLSQLIGTVTRSKPEIPFVSNVTGEWITEHAAMSPEYWAKHTRQTVQFDKGVYLLSRTANQILLEMGPGKVLTGLVRQQPQVPDSIAVISTLPHKAGEASDVDAAIKALGQMWLNGLKVDWKKLHDADQRSLAALPTYPFEHKRYYAEPPRKAGDEELVEIVIAKETSANKEDADLMEVSHSGNGNAMAGMEAKLERILCRLSGFSSAEIGRTITFTGLGLDSLFLTQFSLAVEKETGVKVAFGQLLEKFSTLEKLAVHLEEGLQAKTGVRKPEPEKAAGTHEKSGASHNVVQRLPLTEAQREIWFASQISPQASCSYNESCLLHLKGALNVKNLQDAWRSLHERHEALRVTLEPDGEHQSIKRLPAVQFQQFDFADDSGSRRTGDLNGFLAREAAQPFDLAKGPLARASLIRLDHDYHVLVLTLHHIVCDGHSFGQLLGELGELYSAACREREARLKPAMQLSEFVHLLTTRAAKDEEKASEAYWLRQFSDEVPVLELPCDNARPRVWTFEGAREFRSLPPSLTKGLRRLGAQNGCTLYQTLLAGYVLLLQRLSNQEEVVIGVPVADRTMEGGNTVIGHCVNFLPLRVKPELRQSFPSYLKAVHKLFLTAYEHRDYTFGTLIKKLGADRVPGRTPLTSVTFNVEHWADSPTFAGLEAGLATNRHSFTNFDLGFNIIEVNGTLELDCRYNTTLFSGETIQRWLGHFQVLLNNLVNHPHQLACELEILSIEERQKVMAEWNRPIDGSRENKGETVLALFERQAELTADAVAILQGERTLSYQELNARAESLGVSLIAMGVGPDVPVGIYAERSVEALIGMLGVFKAGGACVPLDPAYPQEWISSMLDLAGIKVLLAPTSAIGSLPSHNAAVIDLDHCLARTEAIKRLRSAVTADNAAGIFFAASGAGIPKGVAMSYSALGNLIEWQGVNSKMGRTSKTLQLAPLDEEMAWQEIWATWCSGGTLVLADEETKREATGCARLVAVNLVQRIFLPVAELQSFAAAVVEQELYLSSLKEIYVTGGTLEVTPEIRKLCSQFTDATLCCQYAPLKGVVAAAYALSGLPENWPATSPIGKPITNTKIFVLDACRQPVPPNVIGEVYVGGECLPAGYFNNPHLTDQDFVPDPFGSEPGKRIYKTGDLARWKPDGSIELLGRLDSQATVQGHRIDLEEIENALARHAEVRKAAVTVVRNERGEQRLVGHVMAKGKQPTAEELQGFLKLPDFMVPKVILFLEDWPVLASGKLDRKALPHPDLIEENRDKTVRLPSNATEESLVTIWSEVLGRRCIGVDEKFFELGGHSLLMMQVISRIRETFQVEMPMMMFFERPTVEALAAEIERMIVEEISSLSDEEVALNARSSS